MAESSTRGFYPYVVWWFIVTVLWAGAVSTSVFITDFVDRSRDNRVDYLSLMIVFLVTITWLTASLTLWMHRRRDD